MIKEDCIYYEKANDMGATINWCKLHKIIDGCDSCKDYILKDLVPVVRCKDCVYFDNSCQPVYSGWCRHLMSTNGNIVTYHLTTEQDFCSRGIRRKDAR